MRRVCEKHPHSRVKRDGYDGVRKQYVRWKCMPANGDRPHLVRPQLSTRLTGGLHHGGCLECERSWAPTDGMPQGTNDWFVSRRRLITRNLHEGLFTSWDAFEAWQADLERYLRADLSKAPDRTVKGLQAVVKYFDENEHRIRKALSEVHHPMTTGRVEDILDDIESKLGDRRRSFRNLARLNDLLTLMHLHLNENADEREWARILRQNHIDHAGKPPPRRLVDGKTLVS
jgi:hypothetical protein